MCLKSLEVSAHAHPTEILPALSLAFISTWHKWHLVQKMISFTLFTQLWLSAFISSSGKEVFQLISSPAGRWSSEHTLHIHPSWPFLWKHCGPQICRQGQQGVTVLSLWARHHLKQQGETSRAYQRHHDPVILQYVNLHQSHMGGNWD